MDTESRTKEPSVTRRKLLKSGAAGALGAAAATAITATPASADDGDPVILGQENFAGSPTRITNPNLERGDSLVIDGGFLTGTSVSATMDFAGPAISAYTPVSGPAIRANAQGSGIIAFGVHGSGVFGDSSDGIGIRGRSFIGTGIRAEAGPNVQLGEGAAFEAVGPVKFSTSGLADVAASTDRVTVNPGVPVTAQSKVLAMQQGNSGNKAMVEHVELNPAAGTFQVVLTKAPARPVQIAWFLMS